MYSGTHMFSQIAQADPEFEMGWFAIPSPDGKTRLVGGGGVGGLAISAEAAKDPDKKAGWVALLMLSRDILETCIDVLGFSAPERM